MRQLLTNFRRSLYSGLAIGLVAGMVSILASLTLPTLAHEQQDCDDNAVIRCGIDHHNDAHDLEELKQKYRENQNGDVQAVFAAFGITSEAALNGMVEGRVTGNNEVFVGNRLVATDVTTAGRQNMSNERGSSLDMGGGRFWQRPPSVSFADPNGSLVALVKMENNTFKFAVILSCGNPVSGEPVKEQPTTQPQPDFEVIKDVRIEGQSQWVQQVRANPGNRVEFRLTIRNSGEANLENVRVRDTLQSGMTYVDNSLSVANQQSTDDTSFFTNTGLTIGSIQRGQQRELVFKVTVNSNTNATAGSCLRLRNTAFARHGNNNVTEKSDDAYVEICREATTATTTPTVTPAVTRVAAATSQPAPVVDSGETITAAGPAGLLGLFTAVTLGGSTVHYFVSRRFR